ncbi:hypothetical protein CRP01_30790 [Flavilitoribacter nigricans DSM 23189 = NBRC 102662]|uniref:Uncharacterized protein n=1 Tax=Flavilitoribacter nigricans (strain ATCC 23147 / DSM 23189 / NBRC 102662 / NCIMB 1420 / SS-2) TaxID=1122177 RepID=A0A2D0N2K3_FLAN2|nr:hypothetical protein CRP01_30790 [Flavilitoribacter nigricans DSM 23189 = NBRC 102662]
MWERRPLKVEAVNKKRKGRYNDAKQDFRFGKEIIPQSIKQCPTTNSSQALQKVLDKQSNGVDRSP